MCLVYLTQPIFSNRVNFHWSESDLIFLNMIIWYAAGILNLNWLLKKFRLRITESSTKPSINTNLDYKKCFIKTFKQPGLSKCVSIMKECILTVSFNQVCLNEFWILIVKRIWWSFANKSINLNFDNLKNFIQQSVKITFWKKCVLGVETTTFEW